MKIEQLLKSKNLDWNDVKRIYEGKDRHCRCGCGGKYVERGEEGFDRTLERVKRAKGCESRPIEFDEFGPRPVYMNIPTNAARNLCFCLYFED